MATANEIILAVMNDVQAVGKKDRNQAQGFNFRGIDAVMNAVGPALRKAGGFIAPSVNSIDYSTSPTKSGGVNNIARVDVTYTVYGSDGSTISGNVVGEAFDSGDKATAKAMSVAYRTFLLQILCLPTDEPDPDTYTYESAAIVPAKALTVPVEELNAIWDLIEGATTKDELRELWTKNVDVLDRKVTTAMGEKTLRALIMERQKEVN